MAPQFTHSAFTPPGPLVFGLDDEAAGAEGGGALFFALDTVGVCEDEVRTVKLGLFRFAELPVPADDAARGRDVVPENNEEPALPAYEVEASDVKLCRLDMVGRAAGREGVRVCRVGCAGD